MGVGEVGGGGFSAAASSLISVVGVAGLAETRSRAMPDASHLLCASPSRIPAKESNHAPPHAGQRYQRNPAQPAAEPC